MVEINLALYDCQISCCDHARRLIEEGHSPEETVHFVRGTTPVFANDFPLEWWAVREVKESTKSKWMTWVPYNRT